MEQVKIDLIKEVAKEVVAEIEKKKIRKKYKKRLHNTRLLMENYNALKNHIEKTDDKNKLVNGLDEDDEIFIESIVKTKMRTIKMMGYVDSAIKIVKLDLNRKHEKYKFLAFKKFYFEKKSLDEISEECKCSVSSARRYIDSVIEELSLILWGIDSLEI